MSEQIVWGEMTAASVARYWVAGASTTDGGTAILWRVQANSDYAQGPGGESVARELTVTLRHTAGGVLRFQPVIDDVLLPSHSAVIGGRTFTVETLTVRATLPQLGTAAEMQVVSVNVPLVRRLTVDGVERARWYLRGERLAVRIDAEGSLGAGALCIDGVVLEAVPVRRAAHDLATVGVST